MPGTYPSNEHGLTTSTDGSQTLTQPSYSCRGHAALPGSVQLHLCSTPRPGDRLARQATDSHLARPSMVRHHSSFAAWKQRATCPLESWHGQQEPRSIVRVE